MINNSPALFFLQKIVLYISEICFWRVYIFSMIFGPIALCPATQMTYYGVKVRRGHGYIIITRQSTRRVICFCQRVTRFKLQRLWLC